MKRDPWILYCEAFRELYPDTKSGGIVLSPAVLDQFYRKVMETECVQPEGELTTPDGYAVLIDDKASSPTGWWFCGIWIAKDVAEQYASKQPGSRVVPMSFTSREAIKAYLRPETEAITLLELAHGNCDLHYDYADVIGMWTGDYAIDRKSFYDVVGEFLAKHKSTPQLGEPK